jgi:hypothetical protein
VRWEPLPRGTAGYFNPRSRVISISDAWQPNAGALGGDWNAIVAAILVHETFHAAGPPAEGGTAGCYDEEVQAFAWELDFWQALREQDLVPTRSWSEASRTPEALFVVRQLDGLSRAHQAGLLSGLVMANAGYQQQCREH